MTLAAILERAKRVASNDVAPRTELELGAHVIVDVAFTTLRGRVAFEDDGWIYWIDDKDRVHATPRQHVRRA